MPLVLNSSAADRYLFVHNRVEDITSWETPFSVGSDARISIAHGNGRGEAGKSNDEVH